MKTNRITLGEFRKSRREALSELRSAAKTCIRINRSHKLPNLREWDQILKIAEIVELLA